MKKRAPLGVILVVFLLLVGSAGCRKKEEEPHVFSPSDGILESGFWKDITALSHVTLCDYMGILVPEDVIEASQELIEAGLPDEALTDYVRDYVLANTVVSSLPASMVEYQKNTLILFYQDYADYYEITLEELLESTIGVATADEMFEMYADSLEEAAKFYLVMQAIAEDAGISVTDDDVAAYFLDQVGMDDYSEYQESYGNPYLKMMVLTRTVMHYLEEGTVLVGS